MSGPSRERVRILESFFASTRSPSQADALQNDTKDSSTDREQIKGKEVADESSERKINNECVVIPDTLVARPHISGLIRFEDTVERCFAIFVANRRRQIHLDQQAIQITGSGHDQLLRAGRKKNIQFTEKDKKKHATLQCNFLLNCRFIKFLKL